MNKIIKTAISLIALTSAFSFAQEKGVKYGAKIMCSMQDPTGKGAKELEMDEESPGFGIGGVANIPIIGKLSFNPELNLLYRGLYQSKPIPPKYDYWVYVKEFALNIPLMLQFAPLGGFYLGAGPQLDIPFNAKFFIEHDKNDDIDEEDFDDRASIDFGVALEVGFHITESIGVGLRAVIGLTEIAEDSKVSYNQYGLGISYFF